MGRVSGIAIPFLEYCVSNSMTERNSPSISANAGVLGVLSTIVVAEGPEQEVSNNAVIRLNEMEVLLRNIGS